MNLNVAKNKNKRTKLGSWWRRITVGRRWMRSQLALVLMTLKLGYRGQYSPAMGAHKPFARVHPEMGVKRCFMREIFTTESADKRPLPCVDHLNGYKPNNWILVNRTNRLCWFILWMNINHLIPSTISSFTFAKLLSLSTRPEMISLMTGAFQFLEANFKSWINHQLILF